MPKTRLTTASVERLKPPVKGRAATVKRDTKAAGQKRMTAQARDRIEHKSSQTFPEFIPNLEKLKNNNDLRGGW